MGTDQYKRIQRIWDIYSCRKWASCLLHDKEITLQWGERTQKPIAAAVSSRNYLAILRTGEITFNKKRVKWPSKTGAGDCWGRAENPPDTDHLSNINCSAPLVAAALHGTAVLAQYVLHVSKQPARQPEGSVQSTTRHRVTAVLSTCLFCSSILASFIFF